MWCGGDYHIAGVGVACNHVLAPRTPRLPQIALDKYCSFEQYLSVPSKQQQSVLIPEKIAPLVLHLRGEKVLLDADIAELYGVTTSALNQAVKRNRDRFPADFMFQLSTREWIDLRSQFAISKSETASQGAEDKDLVMDPSQIVMGSAARHRSSQSRPYAFTEQGVAMLSSVLRSKRAVEVNIAIMRTFVQLRRLMEGNRLLAEKIESLEKKYDEQFRVVFEAIKELIAGDADAKKRKRRSIGFHS